MAKVANTTLSITPIDNLSAMWYSVVTGSGKKGIFGLKSGILNV